MLKFEKKTAVPVYAFRLSEEDKSWLESEVSALQERLNGRRKSSEKALSKSQILLEALKIGLREIKKQR